MQVRQSPRAKVSPDKNKAVWPPRSPYEALLSSPGGRRRWEQHQERSNTERDRSISPSPRRQPPSSSKALQALAAMTDSEEDDEETLQLQLQAIEARLKLKKLQKQKSRSSDHESPRKRQKTHAAALDPAVQIAVSPIKDRVPLPPPTQAPHLSPARLLGIDKGLKAQHVSLKRPRINKPATASSSQIERPKQSFSERIAASRLSTEQQQAKQDRIDTSRSKGFGLQRTESNTSTLPTLSSFSSFARSAPPSSAPQSPFISQRPHSSQASSSSAASAKPPPPSSSARPRSFRPQDKYSYDASTETTSTEPAPDGSSFESFSSLHLSRRKLPHTTLARHLDGKETYTLPRLLKEVKAPVYEPPDCESDFVVFAILASKSAPYDTRPKHHQASSAAPDDEEFCGRNKFMVLKLTDLKWEVDLFLFDTAFEAFWKLTPGTVIAILNPTIMPPKTNRDNGCFSLKLSSSEDSVMELGSARDLGFCTSLKKNGQECGSWVNARKNKFCDYHVELAVSKTRSSRMEVNTMYLPNQKHKSSRVMGETEWARRNDPLRRDGESGERFFMVPGSRSAASLLDSEDFGKQDAMRKRLREKEKDRLLAEKLGQMGNGAGAEYLRKTTGVSSSSADLRPGEEELLPPPKPDLAALGLTGKKASDVRLDPVRKKLFSVLPGGKKTTAAGAEAMGWGGANKRGFTDHHKRGISSPEKGQKKLDVHRYTKSGDAAAAAAALGEDPSSSSPRKKARFQLAKGIREPGRESLGDMVTLSDDDD